MSVSGVPFPVLPVLQSLSQSLLLGTLRLGQGETEVAVKRLPQTVSGDNDSTEAKDKLERGPHAQQAGKPFDWAMNGLTRAAPPGNLGPDNPLLGSGAFCAS